MRAPAEGEQLVARDGVVWIVLRCHQARDDPRYFAIDLIREKDREHSSLAINLTWDELPDFFRGQGIAYPPP